MAADCSIVVLISGDGSNLRALIDQADRYGYRVAGVISNRPEAFGLRRARKAGIASVVVEHVDFPDRASFDIALLAAIRRFPAELIALAGFMRILGPALVNALPGRILNIHPSLLPKYPGMHTHRRVLAAGDREHGASIHLVNEELDGGPIIARSRLRISDSDSETSLADRVRRLEHALYPRVVGWFSAGRLAPGWDGVYFDGRKLPPCGIEYPGPTE